MVDQEHLEPLAKQLLTVTLKQLDLVLSMFDEQEQEQITSKMEELKNGQK